MDKIIDSFEKLFFQVVACLMLLPKTIFDTFKPKFIYNYTSQQFALDEKERFRDHLSPILLLLGLITLSSYLIFLKNVNTQNDSYFIEQFMHDKDISLLNKLTVLSSYFCYFPIQLTLFSLISSKQVISFESIKKPFYIFTYSFCLSLYGVLTMLCLSSTSLLEEYFSSRNPKAAVTFLLIMLVVSFISLGFFSNVYSIKRLLNISKKKSFFYVLLNYIIIGIVNFLLMMVISYP